MTDNFAPSETYRSRAFMLIGAGGLATAILWGDLTFMGMALMPWLMGFLYSLAGGSLIGAAIQGSNDEYFGSLCAAGGRFVIGFVGAFLFLSLPNTILGEQMVSLGILESTYGLALTAALTFHLGFAAAWLKSR